MRVSDKAIEQLRQLIVEKNMQVGERLPSERKLCALLGVSRSTLREAIQYLQAQGMLKSRIGDGTYIQYITPPSSANECQNQSIMPLTLINDLIDQDPSYRFDVQEARLILEGGTAFYAAERATKQNIKLQ